MNYFGGDIAGVANTIPDRGGAGECGVQRNDVRVAMYDDRIEIRLDRIDDPPDPFRIVLRDQNIAHGSGDRHTAAGFIEQR